MKSSEHVLKPTPQPSTASCCKFFQLFKVLVTQASVLTFKYRCGLFDVQKPKSGIWLLELFSRFWEGLFKAYFRNWRSSITFRFSAGVRFQFIKVKSIFPISIHFEEMARWSIMEKLCRSTSIFFFRTHLMMIYTIF